MRIVGIAPTGLLFRLLVLMIIVVRQSLCWSSFRRRNNLHRLRFLSGLPWEGRSHASSEFVTHVVAGQDQPIVEEAIAANLQRPWVESDELPSNINQQLSPRQLLRIGAVWFQSADEATKSTAEAPKTIRLSIENATQILQTNDYLRVHHSPRRFPQVYNYNWTALQSEVNDGVIVAQGEGFLVIDKPTSVPVHPTVDNCVENVVHQIESRVQSYVSPPQRLDQNTSGLFVVARSKAFAAYFAALLRRKTDQMLNMENKNRDKKQDFIQKGYTCLLCIIPQEGSSMADSYSQLKSYDILQHYLEPSIRAPKHFSRNRVDETWLESLLRVTRVGEPFPLMGSAASLKLANRLWGHPHNRAPHKCVGVVEVQIELLTGRTHQIRGQFAAEGYPLVGDTQYGGAIPNEQSGDTGTSDKTCSAPLERMALQCSFLKFLDPDVVVKEDGDEILLPSNRWNEYTLDKSWWSPLLQEYAREAALEGAATTSLLDIEKKKINVADSMSLSSSSRHFPSDLLPPRVALSPGKHKYVLVKAVSEAGEALWFVKSAAPFQCGGPYHANVAQDLVDGLEAMDYTVTVTGGGRIDFNNINNTARVYGFSYGFGRGNHEMAASLIKQHTGIFAIYDNSLDLY
jgi:23S rRNA-/tRNA-specific pseudouridylate synthase